MSIASGVIAGMLVYMLDPERGRRRRHMTRDQMRARMRRMTRGMRGMWKEAAAETYGVSHRMVHLVPRQTDLVDDETLRQRVESQLFRDRHIPKGELTISCEHGMVILRGEIDSPLESAYLEERVRRTAGVRGVHNLLHPHGTTAPNKERSWRAAPHT
jgi:osmotically-inducible protein OsmY